MTDEQKAAYVNAQTALLNAEIVGMVAENNQREAVGASMAYVEHDFNFVIQKYERMLSANSLDAFFREEPPR